MEWVIKLVIPFVSTATDYKQVLTRLASCAFYEIYAITLLLRANLNVDGFFSRIEKWGSLGKVIDLIPHHAVINISGFVIAFIVAILTHIFRFHDKISDLFGIRRRFDRKSILIPLATSVGSRVDNVKEQKIARHRDQLMQAVFYKYASSRSKNPLVDKHDIEHAVNAWSWFWVFVEAAAYFAVATIIAWFVGSQNLLPIFGVISIGAILVALAQRPRLNRYARRQLDTIAADASAAANVRQQFDAL